MRKKIFFLANLMLVNAFPLAQENNVSLKIFSNTDSLSNSNPLCSVKIELSSNMEKGISIIDRPRITSYTMGSSPFCWNLQITDPKGVEMYFPENVLDKMRYPTKKDYFEIGFGEKCSTKIIFDITDLSQDVLSWKRKNRNFGVYTLRAFYIDQFKLIENCLRDTVFSESIRFLYEKVEEVRPERKLPKDK